ncbi:hypothetical protein B0H11DRAFT_2250735 [Mycena galericulata]|nr:hypothetical protein B0H11DRAFT_2250735 [Mycena galericulata]
MFVGMENIALSDDAPSNEVLKAAHHRRARDVLKTFLGTRLKNALRRKSKSKHSFFFFFCFDSFLADWAFALLVWVLWPPGLEAGLVDMAA